jgi:uncharacterized protein YqeY
MLDKIEADLLEAMKGGDELKRDTLRLLKSALKNAEIEKGGKLSEDDAIATVQKEVKRRREAVESYRAAGRSEQASQEERESEILAAYLPSQMSEDEIRSQIKDYLASNPATVGEVGKTMGQLSSHFKGKADLGLVAKIVRELIAN